MLVLAISAVWCGFGGVSSIPQHIPQSYHDSHHSKFASHHNALAAQPRMMLKALDAETFDEALQYDGIAVVKFYAPWCGHCKALEPEWNAAAASLKGKVKLAKVDATLNEKLARRF